MEEDRAFPRFPLRNIFSSPLMVYRKRSGPGETSVMLLVLYCFGAHYNLPQRFAASFGLPPRSYFYILPLLLPRFAGRLFT